MDLFSTKFEDENGGDAYAGVYMFWKLLREPFNPGQEFNKAPPRIPQACAYGKAHFLLSNSFEAIEMV